MPIEVEDIAEPAPAATEEPEAPASAQGTEDNSPPGGAVERPTPEPAPKKRGRPPGARTSLNNQSPRSLPRYLKHRRPSRNRRRQRWPHPLHRAKAKARAARRTSRTPRARRPRGRPSGHSIASDRWTHINRGSQDTRTSSIKCYTSRNHADARCKCTIRRASRGA